MAYQPTPEELEEGTLQTLKDMKTLADVEHSDVALIGGQAVLHYINRLRTTKDIDILTTAKGAPKTVKSELIKHFKDRYRQESEQFEVKVGEHWIQVDMVAGDMFGPHVPAATLEPLANIGGSMPWAGVADLIVMKMFSAPIRGNKQKTQTDVQDVAALAAYGHEHGAKYTEAQKEWVSQELKDDKQHIFEHAEAALKQMFKL